MAYQGGGYDPGAPYAAAGQVVGDLLKQWGERKRREAEMWHQAILANPSRASEILDRAPQSVQDRLMKIYAPYYYPSQSNAIPDTAPPRMVRPESGPANPDVAGQVVPGPPPRPFGPNVQQQGSVPPMPDNYAIKDNFGPQYGGQATQGLPLPRPLPTNPLNPPPAGSVPYQVMQQQRAQIGPSQNTQQSDVGVGASALQKMLSGRQRYQGRSSGGINFDFTAAPDPESLKAATELAKEEEITTRTQISTAPQMFKEVAAQYPEINPNRLKAMTDYFLKKGQWPSMPTEYLRPASEVTRQLEIAKLETTGSENRKTEEFKNQLPTSPTDKAKIEAENARNAATNAAHVRGNEITAGATQYTADTNFAIAQLKDALERWQTKQPQRISLTELQKYVDDLENNKIHWYYSNPEAERLVSQARGLIKQMLPDPEEQGLAATQNAINEWYKTHPKVKIKP